MIFSPFEGSLELNGLEFLNFRPKSFNCEIIIGRLSTNRPSVHLSMWTTDKQNLGSDRPSHGQIRTLDQDYNFEVNEWTDSDDGP